MITIIITSFKEPKTIGKAIESFVKQDIPAPYELIISAPDDDTLEVATLYSKSHKQIKLFKDSGKGKTFAINQLLSIVRGSIIILTDGDVFVSKGSVKNILKEFGDEKVGCVTGQPCSLNPRTNMFGFWSHLLCYAAHRMRLKRHNKGRFLECSGYLWAFRNNGVVKQIPRQTAEDTIVPMLFYLEGYNIKYAPSAKAYVKYPNNMKEFLEQKERTAKGHETLSRYVDVSEIPKMKSMKNEILESYILFSFPKNFKELFWIFWLFPFRLYIWILSKFNLYIKKDTKVDGWRAVQSTK